jgi:predicted nuclease of restriction endonuclease-like (RecB) superfamily
MKSSIFHGEDSLFTWGNMKTIISFVLFLSCFFIYCQELVLGSEFDITSSQYRKDTDNDNIYFLKNVYNYTFLGEILYELRINIDNQSKILRITYNIMPPEAEKRENFLNGFEDFLGSNGYSFIGEYGNNTHFVLLYKKERIEEYYYFRWLSTLIGNTVYNYMFIGHFNDINWFKNYLQTLQL